VPCTGIRVLLQHLQALRTVLQCDTSAVASVTGDGAATARCQAITIEVKPEMDGSRLQECRRVGVARQV
jgi:hypothetical protein